MEALTSSLGDRSLIHAALSDREVASAAWDSWLAGSSLDDPSPAAFSILPAVSRNLAHHRIEDSAEGKLRGLLRYSWTQGQLALRDLMDVHSALSHADIRAVVRRGAPTTERALRDPSAIVMDQTDLLVPPRFLDHTAEVLAELGWTAPRPVPPIEVRSAFSWLPFENPHRRRVAVHWRSFPAGSPLACDEGILRRAVPHPVQGLEVLVPDRTDHALLLCLREPLLAPVERLRWEIELCGVLSHPEDPVDESAFAERAKEGGVLTHCGQVLEALAPVFESAIPGMRIPSLPGPRREEGTMRDSGRSPRNRSGRIASALAGAVERYGDWCRRESRRKTLWGLIAFTRRYYAYEWGTGGAFGMAAVAASRWKGEAGDPAHEAR